MTQTLTAAAQRFIDAYARGTAGLHFISSGACPGCAECGLKAKWRIVSTDPRDSFTQTYGSEDDALDDAFRVETQSKICGDWAEGTVLTVEEIEPSEHERELASEAGFSWSECDFCGSSLGGDRHPAHGIVAESMEAAQAPGSRITHFAICTDCLMYEANGDLPDVWGEEPDAD